MAKQKNPHKKGNAKHTVSAAAKEHVPHYAQRQNETTSNPDVLKWLSFILLALFFAFIPALGNDFVNWDDFAYISENAIIKSLSWNNIKHIFAPTTYVVGNYHPLTVLSYCLEYALVELKPFLYHFDNIILHAANTVLVYFVSRKLFARPLPALLMAALFAVHPLRVESVAWAAERKDVLYTFFFLISLYLYQLYTAGNRHAKKWYILSILAFLFSILSKGQAVVLPLTFILVDYFNHRKFDKKAIIEKIPFFILSIVFGIIAMKAQHTSLTTERLGSHSIFERVLFASYGLVMYLYKFILPLNLSCFYPYPSVATGGYPSVMYFTPFIAIALLAWVGFKYKTNRYIIFGTLFFLFSISIVLQILPVGDAIMADRYTYVPLLGIIFIVVYLIDSWLQKKSLKQKTILYLFGGYVLLLSGISFTRTMDWKNSEVLWTSTIKHFPTTAVAYNNRGVVLLNKTSKGAMDSAFSDLSNAIKYKPEYFEAYSNLGNYYSRKGMYSVELEQYNIALKYNAIHTNSLFNRGLCYVNLKQYDLAIKDYELLLHIDPNNYRAYYSLGIAYKAMGNDTAALTAYTHAIALNGKYDDAFTNRGNIYYNQKEYDKAMLDYNAAIAANPNSANAYFNRSAAYSSKQQWQKAWDDMQRAHDLGYNVDGRYIEFLKSNMNNSK